MGNTYFDVLRLPRNANDAQIGDAYRRLRARYANDPARLRAVEDAYRILANPISRRDYLQALQEGRAPAIDEGEEDGPALRHAQPASQPAPAISLFRRAGATTRRAKTELLDPSGADQSETPPVPPPPPSAHPRRSRHPTELVESDLNPAESVNRGPQSTHLGHTEAQDPPAPNTRTASPETISDAGRDAGRDMTRISPTRRPRTIATVEVAYEGQVEVFELPNGTNWIGRPSKDDPPPAVPLPDPDRFVSRKHARIFLDDSTWTITDNSENGTLLNGKPLRKGQPNRLKDGDVLMIEGRTLTIRRARDG
jgi:hypothetical protein